MSDTTTTTTPAASYDELNALVNAVEAKKKKKVITIVLSDRRPVKINAAEWPILARVDAHDGKVECQANTLWCITVRESPDGRRIVYGWCRRGNGGQPIGWRGAEGGFLIESKGKVADEDETVRAIRRVAGIIGDDGLGDECISSLPEEELA